MSRLPWRSVAVWGGFPPDGADTRMFGLGRMERIERTLARAGAGPVHRVGAGGLPPGLPAPVLLIHRRAVFSPGLLPWLAERCAGEDGADLVVADAAGAPVMASVADPAAAASGGGVEDPEGVIGRIARRVAAPPGLVCFAPPDGPVPATTPGLWRLCSKPAERWHLRGVRRVCFPAVAALANRGVHPDTVSWTGFWIAAAGVAVMLTGGYGAAAGALLLYAGWILDTMDGPLSRLTFQSSASGAALDTRLGRIAYLLTAIALGWLAYGVRGAWNDALTALAVMVAGGVSLITAAVRVDRLAPGGGRLWRVRGGFEHVLHRDNALVIFVCALFGRLDVFIWSAVAVLYAALAVDVALLWRARGPVAARPGELAGSRAPGAGHSLQAQSGPWGET